MIDCALGVQIKKQNVVELYVSKDVMRNVGKKTGESFAYHLKRVSQRLNKPK